MRRRRRRTLVAVAGAVIVVTVGAAGLAATGGTTTPMPAGPPPSAAPVPVEIPRSVLLSPADVGAGPDSQADGPDAFRPLQPDELTLCLTTNRSGLKLPQVPRFTIGVTLLRGTEASRPERPFVLAQQIHRYAGPDAVAVLRDLRSVVAACGIGTVMGDVTTPGDGKVAARVDHTWSIAAENVAGDGCRAARHPRGRREDRPPGRPERQRTGGLRPGGRPRHPHRPPRPAPPRAAEDRRPGRRPPVRRLRPAVLTGRLA